MGRPPKAKQPKILKHPAVLESNVAPPPYLREEAHKFWHETISHLREMGLLTATDFGTIERYAMLRLQVEECHQLEKIYGQYKITFGENEDGTEFVKKAEPLPWSKTVLAIAPALLKIENEWGFTPASRNAVMTTKQGYVRDEDADDVESFERFIEGGSESRRA